MVYLTLLISWLTSIKLGRRILLIYYSIFTTYKINIYCFMYKLVHIYYIQSFILLLINLSLLKKIIMSVTVNVNSGFPPHSNAFWVSVVARNLQGQCLGWWWREQLCGRLLPVNGEAAATFLGSSCIHD